VIACADESHTGETTMNKFYECGICDCIHPWLWNGDCRDDANRLSLDELLDNDILLSMDDRVAADAAGQR